jgi:AbrB family looped-hinge helix DNA binding protein
MRRLTPLPPLKTVTVSSKGQITPPEAGRELLGVKPDDRVILQVNGDELWIRPLGSIVA